MTGSRTYRHSLRSRVLTTLRAAGAQGTTRHQLRAQIGEPHTVDTAIDVLVDEGIIHEEQGSLTFDAPGFVFTGDVTQWSYHACP